VNNSRSSFHTTGRRPTWAEIDLDALASNFHVVKQRVGPDVFAQAGEAPAGRGAPDQRAVPEILLHDAERQDDDENVREDEAGSK